MSTTKKASVLAAIGLSFAAQAARAQNSDEIYRATPAVTSIGSDFAGATTVFTPANIIACLKDFDAKGGPNQTVASGGAPDPVWHEGHAGGLMCERFVGKTPADLDVLFSPDKSPVFNLPNGGWVNGVITVGISEKTCQVGARFLQGDATLTPGGDADLKLYRPKSGYRVSALSKGNIVDLTNVMSTVRDACKPAGPQ